MDEEIKSLLNIQKKDLDKVEKHKVLLLGSGQENTKYDHIKEALGWDDTDKALRKETNKIVELAMLVKDNVDSQVLTQDILLKYCINNNYALINLRDYKGMIPDELLEAIDSYCKANDRNISSEANIANLFILCAFTDTRGNNDELKKSKRYRKNRSLNKIILLEKIDKGNSYSNTHFKIIAEKGEKRPISNLIKSIFMTHTKVANHLNYLVLFSCITAIVLIIGFLSENLTNNCQYYFLFKAIDWLLMIPITILMLKSIWSSFIKFDTDLRSYPEVSYNDISEPHNRYYDKIHTKWFLTSFMHVHRQWFGDNKRLLIIRNQIAFWIMNIIFCLVFFGAAHLQKIHALNKNKVIKYEIERVKAPDNINDIVTNEVYIKTGILSYDKRIIKVKTGSIK